MKTYEQFINENIKPKKNKRKKTFIPVIKPKNDLVNSEIQKVKVR